MGRVALLLTRLDEVGTVEGHDLRQHDGQPAESVSDEVDTMKLLAREPIVSLYLDYTSLQSRLAPASVWRPGRPLANASVG